MLRTIASVGLVAAALAAAPVQAQVSLRMGHAALDSHPFHDGLRMFAEESAKLSNNQIQIRLFPNRQLGDDRQLLEGVRQGTIDGALISSGIFAAFTPVMDALQLPWLINDYDTLIKALSSPAADKLLASLDGLGMKGLGFYEAGQRHFLNSVRPINAVTDFNGLKIRVVPSPLHIEIWKAVGASPTPMAYGEVYTSLQTKVLDGAEMNVSSILTERFYESAKFVTLTGHYFWPGVVAISKVRFDRLTPEQQKVLAEAAKTTMARQIKFVEDHEKRTEVTLRERGVQVSPYKDVAELQRKTAEIYARYESKDPLIQQFVTAVKAIK